MGDTKICNIHSYKLKKKLIIFHKIKEGYEVKKNS